MLELIVAVILLVIFSVCDGIVYCKRKKEEQNYCLGYGGSRYAKKIGNRIKIVAAVIAIIIVLVVRLY